MLKNPYFQSQEEQIKEEVKQIEYPATEQTGFVPMIKPGFTSIIIPVFFNSYPVFHAMGNCIGSIKEHTDKEKNPYEIILVQNGKTGIGFNQENAKDSYADKVIFNEENMGFAKAVNQGIRCAEGEYLAIINSDVQVFDYWLPDMQESLNFVDLIQAYPMYGMPFARSVEAKKLREESILEHNTIENTFSDFRDFSCVMFKREVLYKVGLFNEDFFCYGEDLDFIRRIEKEGGKVASTKRVRTHHIIGLTSSGMPNTPEIMNQSKEILKEIWGE